MRKYTLDSLAHVITQVVHFAWDDILPNGVLSEDSVWSISYIVSCFIAQHTVDGYNGVETEVGLAGLQVDKPMPYSDRLALAEAIIAEFGGPYQK